MRMISLAVALSFGLLVAGAADAKATQCRDTKGKLMKCPPAAAPASTPAKSGPCKDPNGKFIACGTTTSTVSKPLAPTTPTAPKPTVTASTGHGPNGATAKCKDGSFWTSKTHNGACSRHGGVATWL